MAPGDERRQGEGEQATEITQPLWAQCAPHCWAGRTLPVLAAASSGVGECQGGVKGVEMMMVASFG